MCGTLGRHGVVAIISVLALACGGDRPEQAVTLRDSAGVTIVVSRAALWGDKPLWMLSPEPRLVIGTASGEPVYEFSGIEDGLRLPDGRIVVADGGSREIRFYGPDGQFLGATGRRGDAPGEFRLINDIGFGPGDSVWVYDYGARRFTILTDSGRLARTMTLGPELSNIGSVGRLRDGRFVVREYWSGRAQAREVRTGLSRAPTAVAVYAADGAGFDTLGLFPGREVYIGSEGGRPVMSAPLFARNLSAAIRDDEIVIGDQASFELGAYTAAGALRSLFRIPDIDLRLRAADVEAEKEARVATEPPERRARARAHLEALAVPDYRPAYGRLLADAEGNLWVAEHAGSGATPGAWRVFDRSGRWLGTVSVPDRFRPFEIGDDWMLGVRTDEMGVERIYVYAVRKS